MVQYKTMKCAGTKQDQSLFAAKLQDRLVCQVFSYRMTIAPNQDTPMLERELMQYDTTRVQTLFICTVRMSVKARCGSHGKWCTDVMLARCMHSSVVFFYGARGNSCMMILSQAQTSRFRGHM